MRCAAGAYTVICSLSRASPFATINVLAMASTCTCNLPTGPEAETHTPGGCVSFEGIISTIVWIQNV